MIYIIVFLIAFAVVVALAYPLIRRQYRSAAAETEEESEDLRIRREKIYDAIRELEMEREAGSVSSEEYEETRGAYELQAANLLQEEEQRGVARPKPLRKSAPVEKKAASRPPLSSRLGLIIPAAIILLVGVGIGFFLGRSLSSRDSGMGVSGNVPGGERVVGVPTSLEEANAAFNQGDFRRALEGYKRILDSDPKNLDALTQIGVLLARGQHYDDAVRIFDRVLGIRPNYPHALFEKGLVLFQGKVRPREGVKVWEQLIKSAPPDNQYAMTAKRMLDQVRSSMGRPPSAPPAPPSGK